MGSKEALERLCSVYWYPVYAYIRRTGHRPEDAEDLTQGFFFELLEKNFFRAADRKRGKFRSFLLVSLKYFLDNVKDYQSAKKRGGGIPLVSLDEETGENRYRLEPVAPELTPEQLFDQRWAQTLLSLVQAQLREEYRAGDRMELYEALKGFLSAETAAHDYTEAGARLHLKPGTVAVAVHRLRHRYRELVRQEIARTVASPGDVESELRHFFAALTS